MAGILSLQQLQGVATAVNPNQIDVPTGHTLYAPGHIVQVQNTYFRDINTVAITGSTSLWFDIPSLAVSITPKSTNSKIYLLVRWFGEMGSNNWNIMWNLKRNGSVIGPTTDPAGWSSGYTGIHMAATSYGAAGDNSSTPETTFYDFMDTPNSISTLTYQACVQSGTSQTVYTNRTVTAGNESGTSSITAMEIAQ